MNRKRLDKMAAESDRELEHIDREMDRLSDARSARERQVEAFRSTVPCVNCGHPTSPLGSHDCEKWLEAIEPKDASLGEADSGNFLVGSGAIVGSGWSGGNVASASAALDKAQRDIARLEAEKAEILQELDRRPGRVEPQEGTPGLPTPPAAAELFKRFSNVKRKPRAHEQCDHVFDIDDKCLKCGALDDDD